MLKGCDQHLVLVSQAISYDFQDISLLEAALTHPSVGKSFPAVYERLEFLGDRVLGLVIADLLFYRFPNENEGKMARRHAALVCRDALARVAQEIGLPVALRLGKSEEESGGRNNVGTLADACEAVLGAVYADAGLVQADRIIRHHWENMITEAVSPPKDAKTALQEWAQGRGKSLPRYDVVGMEGPPHSPFFRISLTLDGVQPVEGTGKSKRIAEQAAASYMVKNLLSSGEVVE